MATSSKKNKTRPGRTLAFFFVVIIALAGVMVSAAAFSNGTLVPKLALDLEGGTQLILTPIKGEEGAHEAITQDDIDQAIEVIRQRVDSSGVAEAEINQAGQNNIVVGLPGKPSEETLNLVRSSAVMRFRTVLRMTAGNDVHPGAEATPTEAPQGEGAQTPEASPSPSESAPAEAATPTPSATPTAPPVPTVPAGTSARELRQMAQKYSNDPVGNPTDPIDDAWISPQAEFLYQNLNCADKSAREGGFVDSPDKALVTCSKDGASKYILGPMVISGTDLVSASSGQRQTAQNVSTGQWVVNLQLGSEGATKFDELAKKLYPLHDTGNPKGMFAVVLDGLVLSSPTVNAQSFGGRAEISGNFTRQSANTLAQQLQFGSLPLNFNVEHEEQISATLGSEHLSIGFKAALVGLILVVLYLLWQYHALSVIATASLIFAAVLTYEIIDVLSWAMGYRLSLAGVVGLIVAVGTTVDSFIVYFERIRDEVRDGRPLKAAVETGWARAKRTIVISDMVNIIASVVLYYLAVGNVAGFAFTLGLTTAIDLFVIFTFTHPMMALFIRTSYFGQGKKFSGLDPLHLGASEASYVQSKTATKKTISGPAKSLARAKAEAAAKAAEEAKTPSISGTVTAVTVKESEPEPEPEEKETPEPEPEPEPEVEPEPEEEETPEPEPEPKPEPEEKETPEPEPEPEPEVEEAAVQEESASKDESAQGEEESK